MLRQLLLICAIGGLPLVSAAADTAAKVDVPPGSAAMESVRASTHSATPIGTALECTQAADAVNQTQGPVWVVQNPTTPVSPQGPVWVVQQEGPAKPMS